MKKSSKLALFLLLGFAVAVAGYGLITVNSPFAQEEALNSKNVAVGRGPMKNLLTPAGSTFLVRFDNGNGTYTYALYRKVYGGGSAQYFRISQSTTLGQNEDQPNIPIDPNMEKEADQIIDKLGSFSAFGMDDVQVSEYISDAPLSTSLTFPPGAVVVINGNGRPRGIVTCEPACTKGSSAL